MYQLCKFSFPQNQIGRNNHGSSDYPCDDVFGHEHFDGMESPKDDGHPEDTEGAAAQHGFQGRDQGMPHTAEAASADFVGRSHQLEEHDIVHADHGIMNDLGVHGEDVDQRVAEKNEQNADGCRADQGKQLRCTVESAAAVRVAGGEILTGEGNSSLGEGIYYEIGHVLKVLCGSVARYTGRSEADVNAGGGVLPPE